MIMVVTIFIGLIILDMVFLIFIRNNFYNLYVKTLYGKTIEAEVIKCRELPSWFWNSYLLTVEYEIGNTKINKRLLATNSFAKRYEYLRNTKIELVLLPRSKKKVYLKEADWRRENFIYFFIMFVVTLVFFILIMFFISLFVGVLLEMFFRNW